MIDEATVKAEKIMLSLSLYLTNSQTATVDDRRLDITLVNDIRPAVEVPPSTPESTGSKVSADRPASPLASIGVMPPRAEQEA